MENNAILLPTLSVHPTVPQSLPLAVTEESILANNVMLELLTHKPLLVAELTVLSHSVVMEFVIVELSPKE